MSAPGASRVAAIDVGTNTVLLLVADVTSDSALTVIADEERFARLGEGVDASGHLSEAAMSRVLDRLAATHVTAERLGAERVVIGATSASRDARNVDVLAARVRDVLGLDYRVLSGEEEAVLTFRGALALVPDLDAATVLDLGGGSTEVVSGPRDGPTFRTSLDVGSVRIRERFFGTLPASPDSIAAARAFVEDKLSTIPREAVAGRPLVEGGGTARVLAHLVGASQEAPTISEEVPTISYDTVCTWRDRLLSLDADAVRALAPDVLTGREDVMGAAILLLERAMHYVGAEAFIASPGGLRHGLALEAAMD